jgi:hypothetical protein
MAATRRLLTGRSTELIDPLGIGATRTRWWNIQQNGGLTTLSQTGFSTAPTVTGTAAVVSLTVAQFISYTSAAVLNSDAGWLSSSFGQTRRDWMPRYGCTMRTDADITLCRFWIGLFSTTPMAATDPAINGMGFRYSTDVDGTAFWRCWTNGGGAPGEVTTTTVPVTANTIYRMAIVANPSGLSVDFYIDDVLVASHSTDIPLATANLGHVEEVRTLDATPAARVISISKVSCEQAAA